MKAAMKDDLHAGADLVKDIFSSSELRKRGQAEISDAESENEEADDASHRDKVLIKRLENDVNRSKREHLEDHNKIEQLKGMIVSMSAALKAPVAPPPARANEVSVDTAVLGTVMYVALDSTTELARSRQVAEELKKRLTAAQERLHRLESPVCPTCKDPGASVLLHAPLGNGGAAKHMLCVDCLERLISNSTAPICPLCRTPVLAPQVDIAALRKSRPSAVPKIEPDRPTLKDLTESEFRASAEHFMRVYNMDIHLATEEEQRKVIAAVERRHIRSTRSINDVDPWPESTLSIQDLLNIPARFAGVAEYEEYVLDD